MNKRQTFDEDYYQQYYEDRKFAAVDLQEFVALSDFVCAYVKHLAQPVRRVLDIGCGLGWWRQAVRRHFPGARYTGVEASTYLCAEHGWTHGSVVDFAANTPFDLVICQDVLQYLPHRDAALAIDNLASLCGGLLYFNALTSEDWEENCDKRRSDGEVYFRKGDWYRRRLAGYFINAGGGVWVLRESNIVLWELEKASSR